MALTNTQYDAVMRQYEEIRARNNADRDARVREVREHIPRLRELDARAADLSVSAARGLAPGDAGALDAYRAEMAALSAERSRLLTEAGYPADYTELHFDCPLCEDTGYVAGQRCSCFLRISSEILRRRVSGLDTSENDGFSHFSLEVYSDTIREDRTTSPREEARMALGAARELVDRLGEDREHADRPGDDREHADRPGEAHESADRPGEDREHTDRPGEAHESAHRPGDDPVSLLLYGNTGVGKTFLARAIAGEALKKGASVLYFTAPVLFEHLGSIAFGRSQAAEERGLISKTDLLVIDDLGTELTNSFTRSELFRLIDERIIMRRATVISTNLAPSDLKTRYSERISSRIGSSYQILRLSGEDLRIRMALGEA